MNNLKTKAIVIKKMAYKEADLLVTLLTYDNGKIATLARGVKKPKSRFGGNYELLSKIEVELHQGKGFPLIKESKLIIKISKEKSETNFHLIHVFAELINKLVPDHEPHNDVVDLLLLLIKKIDQTNYSETYLFIVFLGALLKQLGYGFISPPFEINKSSNIDHVNFLHVDIHADKNLKPIKIGLDDLKLLKLIYNVNLNTLFNLNEPTKSKLSTIKEILTHSLNQVIHSEIKSLKFL